MKLLRMCLAHSDNSIISAVFSMTKTLFYVYIPMVLRSNINSFCIF